MEIRPADRPTLICIDDDEQILHLLQLSLRSENLRILTTSQPDQALRWVREGGVQLVLCDFRLGGMSGVDLLKEVQAIDPTTVRVILSGYANHLDITGAMQRGEIHQYLLKPWDFSVFREQVAAFLSTYPI